MESVEVLVPASVESRQPGRVAAVDPRVKPVLLQNDGSAPGVESPVVMVGGWSDTERVIEALHKYPSLRWLHLFSAGVDHMLDELRPFDRITVTNSAGLHAPPIAEWVIAMLLMHVKRLPEMIRKFEQREWEQVRGQELSGCTLGIVGAGGLGYEIARRAAGMQMRVVGLRASGEPMEHVARMYRPPELKEMLGECDYVVLCTPLTPETEGMIGEAELAAMRPSAVLLNVARGKVVQTDALTRALNEGRIAAAYLDVTDPEPLPPDHPLWSTPNAFITAHTSAITPRSAERLVSFFCENLRRWLAGKPLENVVDLARGY